MLAALGDLVEDIVVRLGGPINVASDTHAVITRRRGGSAANVAAVAAGIAREARFIGQVGDDADGDRLIAELACEGVDVSFVRHRGRSGKIAVLVDERGERTMLTDIGASRALDSPDPAWLDDVDVLHVPFYSLAEEPIASTAATTIKWAHERSVAVSVDLSSVALLEALGERAVLAQLKRLRPTVVFANADEAALLGIAGPVVDAMTFVKRGPAPATVFTSNGELTVAATAIGDVDDTTGAGDAFAAGVLTHGDWQHDARGACEAGHESAAALVAAR